MLQKREHTQKKREPSKKTFDKPKTSSIEKPKRWNNVIVNFPI